MNEQNTVIELFNGTLRDIYIR